MTRTCDETDHREALLASDFAACLDCLNEFTPANIESWCDEGRTALCPYCGLDFVVGFNGAVDREWLKELNEYMYRRRHGLL